jgi:membrane-bound ClpP family serine protease
MTKITIGFGVLLIAIAGWGFMATGSEHPTALIPAGFGLVFVLFGVLSNSSDPKKRMLWMHISVTVALLLFIFLIKSDFQVFELARGANNLPHPVAIEEKAAASLLSLLYVLFCVRSFILARRARRA